MLFKTVLKFFGIQAEIAICLIWPISQILSNLKSLKYIKMYHFGMSLICSKNSLSLVKGFGVKSLIIV